MQEHINQANQSLLHVYNRFPVIWERGDGCYLYDVNGKKYLDFAAGIAVFALGYNNSYYNNALKAQIDKIIHTSNNYYSHPANLAAKRLTALTGLERVFFTNSGTEAVEGAIKAARKYAYLKDGHSRHEIIAMNRSFHGRTMGALSVTGTESYRTPFEPLIGLIKFADLNDFASVLSLVSKDTCAIILETVQAEGGIYPAEQEFLKKIRALCDEKDILLILDEIQCGVGRTGTMFAYEQYGIKPDILTCAKALGGGFPVGAFLLSERVAANSLKPGDHGSTYGGNPLGAAAINAVLDLFAENNVIDQVRQSALYLEQNLDSLAAENDTIVSRRGMGLLQGLECRGPVGEIILRALDKGLVLINAGPNVIRFVPPLIISKAQIDEMMAILKSVI
ncbi:MAG: aspartate aminotransferase family protein [Lachnospiraceae bacterium]|nr:aspartate aminotransferase family protein [Lachnospiraceae bacterium]